MISLGILLFAGAGLSQAWTGLTRSAPSPFTGLSISRPRVIIQLQRGEEPWVPNRTNTGPGRGTRRRPSLGELVRLRLGLLLSPLRHLPFLSPV